MQPFTFKYDGRMLGLNDYIKVNRGAKGKFFGNGAKKFLTEDIAKSLNDYGDALPKFTKPVSISFHWIETNSKRDPDNVIFAKKFVLDAMVKTGVIPNDGMKNIASFRDTWEVRPDTYGGVFVTIMEV